jgi:hypothetical protein
MLEGMVGGETDRQAVGGIRSREAASTEATRREALAQMAAMSLHRLGRPVPVDRATEAKATAAARAWLELVDSGQDAVSRMAAEPALQEAIGVDVWRTAVRTVRDPLGHCLSRTVVDRSILEAPQGRAPGPWAVIRFEAEFEGRPVVSETVAARRGEDGHWRVAAYFVG